MAVLVLVGLPMGSLAIQPTEEQATEPNLADLYWEIVGDPIRDRLTPLVNEIAPYISEQQVNDFEALIEQLEVSEQKLVEQLADEPYHSVPLSQWKLFGVFEVCNGEGTCGGSYTETEDHSTNTNITQTNYISQGDVSFVICSGNAILQNINFGTGQGTFCVAELNQTVTSEIMDQPNCDQTEDDGSEGGASEELEPENPSGQCSAPIAAGVATQTRTVIDSGDIHILR